MADASRMTFEKLGGEYQLVIETPDDLAHIAELDEAHWAVTDVATDGLVCDPRFLQFLDSDGNGRVRTDEVRAAQAWLFTMLRDRSRLADRTDAVLLDAVDTTRPEGEAVRACAERILSNLGRESDAITLADVRNRRDILASARTNGDGVIPPGAADDEDLSRFVGDIMKTVGAAADAGGTEGVDTARLDRFLTEAKAFLDWEAEDAPPEGTETSDILVRGAKTPAAYAALAAVEKKIDHFFSLCDMTRLDPKAAEKASAALTAAGDYDDAETLRARMEAAPVATPAPGANLPFDDTVNPAWAERLAVFRDTTLPLADVDADGGLSRSDWRAVKRLLAPFAAWQARKPDTPVGALGPDRLREILASDLADRLRDMIREDEAIGAELAQVENVEKLVLYHGRFLEFANNCVSIDRLYDPDRRALFETGTLVLDGRRFTLCVKVSNRAEHKRICGSCHICLLYVHLSGNGNETMEVAAAVTAGATRNLWPGKHGIFFGVDGRQWNAVVVDVLQNPVGLWEAVKQPFHKLADYVQKQAERFGSSRYTDIESRIGKGITEAEKDIKTGMEQPPPAPTGGEKARTARDLVMGGSVAVAALGGTFALVTQTVAKVDTSMVLWVLAALLALVVAPTVLVAWIKLRRRNVSVLLEACGWAVNPDLYLTPALGRIFTRIPDLPEGCRKRRLDRARRFAGSVTRFSQRVDWGVVGFLIFLAVVATLPWTLKWIAAALFG